MVICLMVKVGFLVWFSVKKVMMLVMKIVSIRNRVIECLWMVRVERLKVFIVVFC